MFTKYNLTKDPKSVTAWNYYYSAEERGELPDGPSEVINIIVPEGLRQDL